MNTLLSIDKLSVDFSTTHGWVRAVDELSFDIRAGETVALVGESGCGKSTAALALLRMTSSAQGRITGEKLFFEERDLLRLSDAEMRQMRGAKIAMIFQDPSMYLNPVYSIGQQIAEVLALHQGLKQQQARARVLELLDMVGIPTPAERMNQYPHNLSGGMRQRVMIAMALACEPKLLIADEPTTALDVTIQAQVLDLIKDLKARLGMAVLLITHDLGVVAETADRVVVMYAGRKVEEGSIAEVFEQPQHPYTRGLIKAASWQRDADDCFFEIPGAVPSLHALPVGCSFAGRCAEQTQQCQVQKPAIVSLGVRRMAECFRVRTQP